jgi:cation:H+ antiporter
MISIEGQMPAVLWDLAVLAAGLAVIYLGGRLLIHGARSIALRLGIRPIVVGVTIVAFGTSAPELFLAIASSLQGAAPVSVGNVLGANANDLTIVLGLAAVILPLATNFLEARFEIIATFSSLLLFGALALDGGFGWVDGIILISFFSVLLYMLLRSARVPTNGTEGNGVDREMGWRHSLTTYLALLVFGIAALALGADMTISSSVNLARSLGVSELIIGATIVSIGTTLPELTVSILSALRGEPDLAVGNALGSVFFNTLVVTGTVALISGVYFETSVVLISTVFLISVTLLIAAMVRWKYQISRLSGAVLIALYVVFVVMMIALG